MSETPKMRLGAERLEKTRVNAEYWLNGARNESRRDHAVLNAEQAINAWKNAAYGLAEELAKLSAPPAAEVADMVARLRALSRHEHDDLSIGDEAAAMLTKLAAQVAGWK